MLQEQVTNMRVSINAEKQVAIAIWKLANLIASDLLSSTLVWTSQCWIGQLGGMLYPPEGTAVRVPSHLQSGLPISAF